ncbi:MAG: serine--tRNA ligase [bacterium]
MLDIKFIRENPELIREAARKKHINFNVDELISSDQKRVEKLSVVESLRAEQNLVSDKIPSASPEERQALIAQMSLLKEDLKKHEEELKVIMTDWQKLMLAVPNVPDISVPEGDSDAGNMEERVWGDKPAFNFPVKDHIALCEDLDLADFERGAKVAGFRGYFLKNEAVLIEMALWQMFNEKLVNKGFTPMIVPSLVNKKTLVGTGYLPGGEDDLYRTQDDEYLAGTGEVATMSYYSDEIIDGSQLPIKLAAFSPCFRREAGSHSKDTKGLIRVHEFFKLEQVVLCEASHTASVALHEEITTNVEELLQELELPYHVVVNCGGDLGQGQVKKYDIEVWMPSQNTYRETHSASYFHDYQTRRLNIRYRDSEGKLRFVHSLNNTAVATPRIVACILENYQQADGTIKIPTVLQKYINKELIVKK